MTTFPVVQIVFYFFSFVLVLSATMVVLLRDLVKSVLFLVLSFFSAAVLWMLLQAEFLSLVLIFVYVGAVMTLFVFVVMMLSVDQTKLQRATYYKFMPLAVLLLLVMLGIMVFVLDPSNLIAGHTPLVNYPADYDNVDVIGTMLYTDYIYPVEIVAAILLVAMISAIVLGFFGSKKSTKHQKIAEQESANKQNRLRIIKDGD
jgi:NADH-quinone oxidoreductase subunit J